MCGSISPGYLDGTLDAALLEEVQKHLEHCEICSAILDSTRNILILTADERVFELPLGFSERLHARLEAEMRGSPYNPPGAGGTARPRNHGESWSE